MAIKFRKPQKTLQGLKILAYGEDGAGKSLFGLSFPKIAIIDTEAKLGVYENNSTYNKNLVAIADSVNYYDVIELLEQVTKNTKEFSTFITDSETNLYEIMQVACMEVEEERARKKGGNVEDSVVSMRGYGKIKLNNARLKNLKAQASANGVTIISIAHKEDIFQEVNGKQIKLGEKPALRKNSKHDYDVVLRFYKEKDVVTGEYKYMAEVEKDTTSTYKLGTRIEGIRYDHFKEYIEQNQQNEKVETSYNTSIEANMDTMKREQKDHETIVNEFKKLYKELAQDAEKKKTVAKLMKEKGVEKYTDPSLVTELKEVIAEMKKM